MKKKSFNWKTFLYILIPLLLVAIISIRLKKNTEVNSNKKMFYSAHIFISMIECSDSEIALKIK